MNRITYRDTIGATAVQARLAEDRDMKLGHCIAAFILIAWLRPVVAAELNCRVVALSDGDTFTCLDADKHQHKIRLANIDTPEKNQPYGAKAQQLLSGLIFNKLVRIDTQASDRYGRMIGLTYVDDINVNREMVARGAAWVYPRYNLDQLLPALENIAKSEKLGVWALDQAKPIPPWEWRTLDRHLNSPPSEHPNQSITAYAPLSGASGVCEKKRLCGQMTDCAEAKFYLEQCGVLSLDRDRDGVPCEKLCK